MKRMWAPAVAVSLNFFITLSLFPGLMTSIPSSTKPQNWTWFPIILIAIFSVFDFIGKTIPGITLKRVSERNLYIMTGLRFLFFFAFIFCINPKLFNSDAFPVIFDVLFALSNGYLATTWMMIGPSKVEIQEKELAGTIMALALVSGLTLGASFGFTMPMLILRK